MNNPITNEVFDTRDLIEYKEYLENELVENYNNFIEEYNESLEEENYIEEVENLEEIQQWNGDFLDQYSEEVEEYESIDQFCENLSITPDFNYGEAVIHEDYFTEYAEDLTRDCGYVSKNLPYFLESNIDWGGVAEYLKPDYCEVEYRGENYLVRY